MLSFGIELKSRILTIPKYKLPSENGGKTEKLVVTSIFSFTRQCFSNLSKNIASFVSLFILSSEETVNLAKLKICYIVKSCGLILGIEGEISQ